MTKSTSNVELALDALLTTKTSIPPARAGTLSRPRLSAELDAGLDRKLTLLSAPAGYGKTTLLAAWARDCELPIAWVALDETGMDLARFLQYMVAAVRPFVDEFGRTAISMLRPPATPSAERLATSLINDLAAAASDLVIVLDDYHFLETQAAHDLIAFVLEHMPTRTHLMISTRSDPPLQLASLRAADQLVELRASNLQFSNEEAGDFLASAFGIEMSPETVARLDQQVEGWAAGLQLAGLALKGRKDLGSFIDRFSGSHRYIVDYLADEVMMRQTAEVRAFLLETSILDRLTPSLCDVVTNRNNSRRLLLELEQSNLFLIPLDDRREWYRYHHLFRDALGYRLAEQSGKQALSELHRRAATWYQDHGFAESALEHWMQAPAVEEAAELIEAEGIRLLAQGQLRKLQRWIDAVPGEIVRRRPWLSIQSGWILNLTGQLEQMELRLQDAERAQSAGDPEEEKRIRGYIATIRAGAARKQHQSSTAIRYLQQALENLPQSEVMVRSSAHFNLGSTYLDLGETAHAETELGAALLRAEGTPNTYSLIAGRSYLADTYVLKGQLRRAARTYQRAIREGLALNGGSPNPLAGYAHSGLAEVLYERNALDEAEDQVKQALDLGELLSDRTIERRSLQILARIQSAGGKVDQAEVTWERAIDLAQEYGDQVGEEYLKACRARMWLERVALSPESELPASAIEWAEGYRAGSHVAEDYREVLGEQVLAWVEISEGKPQSAAVRLERLSKAATEGGRMSCAIKIHACLALARQQMGEPTAAQSILRETLVSAAPEGYCRSFVDFGWPMRDLLESGGIGRRQQGYVRTLLGAFALKAQPDPVQSLAEPLTKRELEVLRLLAAGRTNQEIADQLVLAIGTVKQYNHVIFRKLEVHTRHDAARRASELGLL